MRYTNPEQLFKELTTKVLNDPDIDSNYKDYIRNCIALNIDLDSKERIIKQIANHYLFISTEKVVEMWSEAKDRLYMEGFNKLIDEVKTKNTEMFERFEINSKIPEYTTTQSFYTKEGSIDNYINPYPEYMYPTIQNMNKIIKDLKIPSYTEMKTQQDNYTLFNLLKDMLTNDTSSDPILYYNGRIYPESTIEEIFNNDDIYKQVYYRKMLEVDCLLDKLETHNRTFNNFNTVEEWERAPLYAHHIHLNRVVNAHYENYKSNARRKPTTFETMVPKPYSIPLTEINISELSKHPYKMPNLNENRSTRRKSKKEK